MCIIVPDLIFFAMKCRTTALEMVDLSALKSVPGKEDLVTTPPDRIGVFSSLLHSEVLLWRKVWNARESFSGFNTSF